MRAQLIYKTINVALAGVFGFVIIYSSLIFPNSKNSVSCYYEQKYGVSCPTCGVTRAFNSIIKGDLKIATELNKNSLQLFCFFSFQFLMRLALVVFNSHVKSVRALNVLIISDITVSSFLFILAFRNIVLDILIQ